MKLRKGFSWRGRHSVWILEICASETETFPNDQCLTVLFVIASLAS